MDDPLKVFLFIKNIPHHTPVNIFFWGWDAQDVGHAFKGGIVFEISKLPEIGFSIYKPQDT
jgi:hypothetical protein